MVRIIEHNQVDSSILSQIVEIKKLSWNYSIEEHLRWMTVNLTDTDLHLMIYENNELIAYLNFVRVCVLSNNKSIPCLGIGNVCTKYKGQGDGKKLMNEANAFLLESGSRGLLFCKKSLVDFYLKNQWHLIQNLHPNLEINTMVFNFNNLDSDLKYNQRLF